MVSGQSAEQGAVRLCGQWTGTRDPGSAGPTWSPSPGCLGRCCVPTRPRALVPAHWAVLLPCGAGGAVPLSSRGSVPSCSGPVTAHSQGLVMAETPPWGGPPLDATTGFELRPSTWEGTCWQGRCPTTGPAAPLIDVPIFWQPQRTALHCGVQATN